MRFWQRANPSETGPDQGCELEAETGTTMEDDTARRETAGTTRWAWSVWGMLMAGLLLFGWVARPKGVGFMIPRSTYFNDAPHYLAGAISWAEGRGYRCPFYLQEPALALYPPLQSLWLAPGWKWGGGLEGALQLWFFQMWFVSLVSVSLLYHFLIGRGVTAAYAGICGLLLGTSPWWWDLIIMSYSDATFAMLAFALAWAGARWRAEFGVRGAFGLGCLVALMYLTRTAAVAVAGAVGLWFAYRTVIQRRERAAWEGLAFAVPVLAAFFWWKSLRAGGPGYLDYFGQRIAEEGGWLGYLAFVIGQADRYLGGRDLVNALGTVPYRLSVSKLPGVLGRWEVVPVLVGLGVMALIAVAIKNRWRGRDGVAAWVIFAYLAQLTLWPFPLGTRAIFAVLPFLMDWFWRGSRSISATWLGGRWAKSMGRGGLAAGIAVAGMNARVAINTVGRDNQAEGWGEIRALAEDLRKEPFSSALVAAGRDVPLLQVWSTSGRQFLANPFGAAPRKTFADFRPDTQGNRVADYVIYHREWLHPPLDPIPEELRLSEVRKYGAWTMLRVERRDGVKP